MPVRHRGAQGYKRNGSDVVIHVGDLAGTSSNRVHLVSSLLGPSQQVALTLRSCSVAENPKKNYYLRWHWIFSWHNLQSLSDPTVLCIKPTPTSCLSKMNIHWKSLRRIWNMVSSHRLSIRRGKKRPLCNPVAHPNSSAKSPMMICDSHE